ncbi:MAG: hypothetical protein ACTSPD_17965 [Promethearchaeota archaeon]
MDKYADSSDYMEVVEEFNRELEKGLSKEELLKQMKRCLNIDVFRTRDEVISKLSNEVAQLKMLEYDYERKFKFLTSLDILSVKGKVLILLAANESLSFNQIKNHIKTSKKWLESVIETLIKNNLIGYSKERDAYFLKFE